MYLPILVVVAKCFGDAYGSALTAWNILSNTAMALLPPLLEHWREKYGLNGALLLLGAFTWNIMLCGVLTPRDSEQDPTDSDKRLEGSADNQKVDENCSVSESRKLQQHVIAAHPTLRFLYLAQFCNMFVLISWAMFLLPYGVEKGHRQGDAVILSTIGGIGVVLGRILIFLVFYWKYHNSLMMIVTPLLLLVSSFILLTQIEELPFLCLLSFISGASVGFISSWIFAYTRYVTCFAHFQSASAWSSVVLGVGIISSGLVSGNVYKIIQINNVSVLFSVGKYSKLYSLLLFLLLFLHVVAVNLIYDVLLYYR